MQSLIAQFGPVNYRKPAGWKVISNGFYEWRTKARGGQGIRRRGGPDWKRMCPWCGHEWSSFSSPDFKRHKDDCVRLVAVIET